MPKTLTRTLTMNQTNKKSILPIILFIILGSIIIFTLISCNQIKHQMNISADDYYRITPPPPSSSCSGYKPVAYSTTTRPITIPTFGQYPYEAKLKHVTGDVIVQICVNQDGIPTFAVAIAGPRELREAAINSAMKYRFSPYLINGNRINVTFYMRFIYRLR